MSEKKYFLEKREEMFDFIPARAGKLLDVGCGAAAFSSLLKEQLGAEVWGIEINAEAASAAARKLDKVIVSDVESAIETLPDNYFDCIIFNDVLEHLVDPYSVLHAVQLKLAEHGVLVCSIPNVRHFSVLFELVVKKKWEYRDDGILDRTHLRFFTESSIRSMFEECGYDLVQLEGIHKTRSLLVKLVNLLSLGWFSDALYLQFACVAKLPAQAPDSSAAPEI